MRQRWSGVVLLWIAVVPVVRAQVNMGQQQQSLGANQSVIASIVQPVTDAPYKANKVSRSVQKLADGTVITHETKGLIARDAQGRVREDLNIVHSGQMAGRETDMSLQSATVGDPVTHTILMWTGEKTKVAMQMLMPSLPATSHIPGSLGAASPVPSALPGRVPAVSAGMGTGGPLLIKDDSRTEELGKQSIDGVLVTGKRMTTTIPTGKIGNDRPIIVVHEEWQSPELKVLVKTIDTDPRSGEQTMILEGLVRTDPDEALFHAPEGYEVKDLADLMKGLGQIGRPKAP
jgi:hypothetical protein